MNEKCDFGNWLSFFCVDRLVLVEFVGRGDDGGDDVDDDVEYEFLFILFVSFVFLINCEGILFRMFVGYDLWLIVFKSLWLRLVFNLVFVCIDFLIWRVMLDGLEFVFFIWGCIIGKEL